MSWKKINSPRYREAYPRLNIFEARSGFRQGRRICTFTDDCGRRLGYVFLRGFTLDEVVLCGTLFGPYLDFWNGQAALRLLPSPSPLDPQRVAIRCSHCGGQTNIVVYTNHWTCADCRSLRYRQQLVHPDTLLWERREALKEELKRGRPKGMHQRTYAKLVNEYDRLNRMLKGRRRPVPAIDHSRFISSDWVSSEQANADPMMDGFNLLSISDGRPPTEVIPEEKSPEPIQPKLVAARAVLDHPPGPDGQYFDPEEL